MNILDRRKEKSEAILKDRFIRQQLTEEKDDIDADMTSLMQRRGFKSEDFYSGRDFRVTDNRLDYFHRPKHRFADMKYLTGKNAGRYKKKSHPIHNPMLFGHVNNALRRLQFGYTEAVKEQLAGNLPDV